MTAQIPLAAAPKASVVPQWADSLWTIAAVSVGVIVLVTLFKPLLLAGLFVLAVCWLYWQRERWLPTLQRWIDEAHAWLIVKMDDAPRFWIGAPKDETHAGYRADYEALVTKPARTRSELLSLAEIIHGLEGYGDNPLSRPPTLTRQVGQGFLSAGSIMSGALSQWTLVLGLGALAVMAGLFGWAQTLKYERDAPCTRLEVMGHTSRQACLAVGAALDAYNHSEAELQGLRQTTAGNVGSQAASAQETVGLNQRRAARHARSEARVARAHVDDVEAARDGRAPDWDSRLRDFAGDTPSGDGPAAGNAARDGASGGVSNPSAAAPVVSSPAPAGPVAGDGGSGPH